MSKFFATGVFKIIIFFLAWRIFTLLLAFAAPVIIPEFGAKFPYFQEILINTTLPHFIWSQGNFDGVHYLRIAQDGYIYQYTQAFFPVYPILIKIGSFFTFGNELISALLVSNLSFLAALIVFFKLVREKFNENIAKWSCIFLLSFPTSFYFGAIYTEGLFFLLVVSAFYMIEKGKFWQGAIIGSVASATRLVGVFLAFTLTLSKKNIRIPFLVVPIGLLFYMIYLQFEFQNPFYFLTAQSVWGQERSTTNIVLLPQVFYRYLKILLTTNGLLFFNALFELSTTIFALLTLYLGRRLIKREWLIFSLLAILTPTLTGTLASMPRYILVGFPIFIILAHLKNRHTKFMIAVTFVLLLTVTTILFSQGYWVA